MINILISVDKNYLEKAETMLYSLHLRTKEDVAVYLLNHRLTDNEVSGLREYLRKRCKMSLTVIDVSKTDFDSFPTVNPSLSIEMYYRILAQFLLPAELERVLWLDADIIIKKDISEFYHQDFDGMAYVVCPDIADKLNWFREIKEKLALPQEYVYFNSGVMLMNLPYLRENTTADGIIAHGNSMIDKLTFPDQDILNTFYRGRLKYAEWKKYNYQTIGIDRIDKKELKEIVILHYCCKVKPWVYGYTNNVNKHYWRMRLRQGHIKEALPVFLRGLKHKLQGR